MVQRDALKLEFYFVKRLINKHEIVVKKSGGRWGQEMGIQLC
jgi:hypothetical protein